MQKVPSLYLHFLNGVLQLIVNSDFDSLNIDWQWSLFQNRRG